jgi:hypothetical protein
LKYKESLAGHSSLIRMTRPAKSASRNNYKQVSFSLYNAQQQPENLEYVKKKKLNE